MSSVCITGYGAVLPNAPDPASFWQNLLAGRSAIRPLPPTRWDAGIHCHGGAEGARCNLAGFVDDRIIASAASKLRLPPRAYTRLQIMTLAAAEQAMAGLHARQAGIFLGCMSADEAPFRYRFLTEEVPASERSRFAAWDLEPSSRQPAIFTSSVLWMLQRRFGLHGETMLVDAACASSLAAIDIAVRALEEGRIDFALSGGIESNLGPDTFVLFSRLGALSPEPCLPLDQRSRGLSQGEGAVIFALERLEDAQRLGHPVLAVIRGRGASSDGAGASLFEPTTPGQLRAMRHAYRDADSSEVDYVECHGTGTPTGDTTEVETLRQFFGRRIAVGSVKAMVGHTKGAAGATGLLKCVLAIQHRQIPPSPYCTSPRVPDGAGPFVNTQPILLRHGRPLQFGVSSFGFGGINYHLAVSEPGSLKPARKSPRPEAAVVVAHHVRTVEGVRNESAVRALRIPPHSLPQIDELQLAGILAVQETAKAAGIDLAALPGNAISVISASTLGLDATYSLSHRVRHAELKAPARERHAPVTEDTGPGTLNNVVAGRIANHFNFTGASFNVDADLASRPAALWAAGQLLGRDTGLVIVLAAEEIFDESGCRVRRPKVECCMLATLDFALTHGLPIQARLDVQLDSTVREEQHACA